MGLLENHSTVFGNYPDHVIDIGGAVANPPGGHTFPVFIGGSSGLPPVGGLLGREEYLAKYRLAARLWIGDRCRSQPGARDGRAPGPRSRASLQPFCFELRKVHGRLA